MKQRLLLLLLLLLVTPALCQTAPQEAVRKAAATDEITEDLDFGTGRELTIKSGATFNYATGAALAGNLAEFRDDLGVEIGADVQAYNARLADIAGISFSQGDILYYNGSALVRLAAGISGHFLQTQGAGANPQWAAPSATGMPRSYLAGLRISNNGSDAANDIDVAVGAARGSSNAADLVLASALTKRLDANWAAGTNQGMRNSAAAITDTTYHIWLVSDGSTVDVYAHTSATAATVLTALQAESGGSGYLYLRRIGSIIRASSTILPFVQDGDEFTLVTPILNVDVTDLTTARSTYALTVPLGVRVNAKLRVVGAHGSAGTNLWVGDLSETDAAPSFNASPLTTLRVPVNASVAHGGPMSAWTNTSAQIGARSSASTTTLRIATLGWIDRRGRDD